MATGGDNDSYLCSQTQQIDDLFNFEEEVNYRSGTAFKIQEKNHFETSHPVPHKVTSEAKVDEFPTLSLFHLTFSLLQCTTSDPTTNLWEAVQMFFDERESVDVETNSDAKVLFGNFYQTPRDCSFLVSVAKVENSEQSIVDVTRLNGDAFLLHGLFEEMKDHLREMVFLTEEDDDEDSDSEDEEEMGEYEFGFETEEEVKESLDFEDNILQFENDKGLLYMMLNNFDSVHLDEKNYHMSLLAHSSQREDNKCLMLEGESAQKVKDLVCNTLQTPKDSSNATLIRNTLVFLNNLVGHLKLDDDILIAVVKAMGDWCPGHEDNGQVIGYLQSSRQVMIEIDEILSKVMENNEISHEDVTKIVSQELEELQTIIVCRFAQQGSLDFRSQFFKKLAEMS